jgi:hypothetical protein
MGHCHAGNIHQRVRSMAFCRPTAQQFGRRMLQIWVFNHDKQMQQTRNLEP